VTPRAAAKLKTLQDGPVLRRFVNGRACCGLRYGLALEDEIRGGRAVHEQHGLTLDVDPDSRADCDGDRRRRRDVGRIGSSPAPIRPSVRVPAATDRLSKLGGSP
jgi:hypothetical protein